MRLLVYSHSLQVGGSQIVSIILAGEMRARGYEVAVAGPPGPLAELAMKQGLRVYPVARRSDRKPSVRAAVELHRVISSHRPDVVHAYSHSACIEAFFAGYVVKGLPLICSTRGRMAADPFPRFLPTIVAQAYVGEAARRLGQRSVYLMPPVVDTEANSPDANVADMRGSLGIDDDTPNIVLVSRLGTSVKLEGVQRAIKAVSVVARRTPVRLIVVGDGSARGMLNDQAEIVNDRFQRPIVLFAGEMLDPRPAYALADIVLGMQGSILRGMAFAKPAIVLGQRGYSEIVSAETVGWFLQDQFYGVGDGDLSEERLVEQIASLLADQELRQRLGELGREVVCDHVSLRAAADLAEEIYATHGKDRPSGRRRLQEALRFSWDVVTRKVKGHSTGGNWHRHEGGHNRGLERLDVAPDTGEE